VQAPHIYIDIIPEKCKTMIPVNIKTGIVIFLICLSYGLLPANNYAENRYILSGFNVILPGDEKFLPGLAEEEASLEEEAEEWIPLPAKAAMLSAALPGLGQVYNRKYWKVPIIYAGFGAAAYFLDMNSSYYQKFRRAFYYRLDGNPHTVDDMPEYSTDQLRRGMNYYRRNVEITYIVAAALYILNILDANVDAHLMDFDITDELSFNMKPFIENVSNISQPGTGVKLTIRF